MRGFRDKFGHEILGGFFQSASRLASLRIANDYAVWRIGRVLGNSRQGKSFCIGPVGVAVVTLQKNRAIRKQRIEIFPVRERFRSEHRVVPAASQQPSIAGMLGGILTKLLLDVSDIQSAVEIHS